MNLTSKLLVVLGGLEKIPSLSNLPRMSINGLLL